MLLIIGQDFRQYRCVPQCQVEPLGADRVNGVSGISQNNQALSNIFTGPDQLQWIG